MTREDTDNKKGGLFADLSIAQIVAAAAAAVTSMLLASKIGVAGSVIGVAVASVVATVSSQIYKNFLSASADKLHNLRTGGDDASADEEPSPDRYQRGSQERSSYGDRATSHSRVIYPDGSSYPMSGAARTTRMQAAPQTANYYDRPSAYSRGNVRERTGKRYHSKTPLKVIIVTIISALVAVALTAGIIDLATMSQGIGTKTESLFSNVSDTTATDSTQSTAQTNQTGTSATNGTQSSNSATTSQNSSQNSTGSQSTDSSSTQNTSGTTTGGSTDSSGSSSSSSSSNQDSSGSSTSNQSGTSSGTTTDSGSSGSSTTSGSSSDSSTTTSGSTSSNG